LTFYTVITYLCSSNESRHTSGCTKSEPTDKDGFSDGRQGDDGQTVADGSERHDGQSVEPEPEEDDREMPL
jgi:hypothetical protein